MVLSFRKPSVSFVPTKEGLTKTASMDRIYLNPGALGAEETRQSIPNLAVKLCCGDNTAGGALWEDSSAPGLPFFWNHWY